MEFLNEGSDDHTDAARQCFLSSQAHGYSNKKLLI